MIHLKKSSIFFLCLLAILILFGCEKSGEKNMGDQNNISKEYDLSLNDINIKFSDIVIKKITNSESKEYRFDDDENLKALTKLLNDLQLKKINDGLKLEPKEYYYITFNSTDHLTIIGKYHGQYYSHFVRNNGTDNDYIDLVSNVDVTAKIEEFLNESMNTDKK